MEQFKQFNLEKQFALQNLTTLKGLLEQLSEIGFDIQKDHEKLESAIQSIESDVLRIALLGAFSDGKTSVIAAWLGKVMHDMKIDMDESSDRLSVYRPEGLVEQCEIVDTPGLFGDKTQTIDGQQVMYEDLTKRYISEAHLILYVVDATNPLKDSHSDIARWILRDLDKLGSTVFVINKMDEVTDLTEEALFTEQASIKRENLKKKLARAANLTADELNNLNIVCMAANPNGRGLPFWFGKPAPYESRSRINDLKATTQRVLKANVPEVLRAKTGLDVVRDVVSQKLVIAQSQLTDLQSYSEQNREESTRIEEDIQRGRSEVRRLACSLSDELRTVENQLLGQLRPLSLEDIYAYLEDEIGYSDDSTGYKLNLRIKSIVTRYFEQSSSITGRISNDIRVQLDAGASFLETLSNKALGGASTALKGVSHLQPEVIKQTIFAARDVLGSVTGVAIKFKPWQATKMAGSISKWAGPVGGALQIGADLYQAYKASELERELKKVKAEMTELVKSAFKDIYAVLADDEKTFEFFAPQFKEFENILHGMKKTSQAIQADQEKVRTIQLKLEQISQPRAPLPVPN